MKPFGCAINASVTIVVVWAPSIEKRPKMNFKVKTSSVSGLFLIHKPHKIHVHKKFAVLKDAKLVWSSSRSFSDVTILRDKLKRTAEKRPQVCDELL